MNKLIVSILALSLMGATAASADVGAGVHVGPVGVGAHVGIHDNHHARECASWGWRHHHHDRYCRRWSR